MRRVILLLVGVAFAVLAAWYLLTYGFAIAPWLKKTEYVRNTTTVHTPCPPRKGELELDRVHRLTVMHGRVALLLKQRRITKEEAAVINRHLDARPDGDVYVVGGIVKWSVTLIGRTRPMLLTYHLVCICTPQVTSPVPPKIAAPPKHYVPPPPKRPWMPPAPPRRAPGCFAYQVDGRGYPVKMPLEAVISFYQHGGGLDDFYKAMNSKCFYAVDGGTGERLYLDRGCFICQDGEEQNTYPLDVYVGTKATLVVTVRAASGKIGFPSGYGTVYLPFDWVAETSLLWCFTAIEPYYGENGGGAVSLDYFDRVSLDSVLPDIPRHKYHRVIKPDGKVYGPGYKPGRP